MLYACNGFIKIKSETMILTVQYNVCPKCGKSFEKLIIITDKSKNPPDQFYGCPCCYSKLESTESASMKKIEKKIEVIKTKSGVECPKYFGYLADSFCKKIMPTECLDCTKMNDCMTKSSSEPKKKKTFDNFILQ